MKSQKSSRFTRLAIVILALGGVGVITNWVVPADAAGQNLSVQMQKAPAAVIVAQSATQTPSPQETETPSESQKSKSNTEEKKEAAEPKKKSLKNFRPSEQIEADQAVDFPYDI